jgi:hypothetical protein
MTTLSPNLVPHEAFHHYDWWKISGCDWWWSSKRKEPNLRIGEISHVDSELISLVGALWSMRIPTTPSCAGHTNFDQERRKIYDSIQRTIERKPSVARSEIREIYDFELEPIDENWMTDILTYQNRGVLGWKTIGWETFCSWPGQMIQNEGISILMIESPKLWKTVEKIWLQNHESFIS